MKKTLILLVTLLICGFGMQAKEASRVITFEELPTKAQQFVTTHFSDFSIRFVRLEIEVQVTKYTVRFDNGMEIEFNSVGDWTEVESHFECLPTAFVNAGILDYLNKHHPGFCLHEISIGKRMKYEVELANGLEIVFNKNGEFLHYDD